MNRALKAKIIEKFGSQWEFAQAIGQHEAFISKIVRGRRHLGDAEKQKWALALNIKNPDKFFPNK